MHQENLDRINLSGCIWTRRSHDSVNEKSALHLDVVEHEDDVCRRYPVTMMYDLVQQFHSDIANLSQRLWNTFC